MSNKEPNVEHLKSLHREGLRRANALNQLKLVAWGANKGKLSPRVLCALFLAVLAVPLDLLGAYLIYADLFIGGIAVLVVSGGLMLFAFKAPKDWGTWMKAKLKAYPPMNQIAKERLMKGPISPEALLDFCQNETAALEGRGPVKLNHKTLLEAKGVRRHGR